MEKSKYFLLAASAMMLFALPTAKATAQVSVGVNIGAAPACPYGYYDYAPYNCAAYGYYGPEWFNGGVFIGAGPWFHGPHGFWGHVNHDYDPRYGYHGAFPAHGAYHEPPDHFNSFRASHFHDEGGHAHGLGERGPR